MNKLIITRIVIDFIILISVISGWWHIALIISMISLMFFPFFIEMIIFGIIFDALFGYNQSLGISKYAGTILSVSIFLIIYWLQNTLRR
jgi:hypothetical protein